jgi:hypothetical protein
MELLDADGRPVLLPGPEGEKPVVMAGQFEVGRPPGVSPGTPLDMPLALTMAPLPLLPGRYVWKLSINNATRDEWEAAFTVRPPA